MLLFAICGILLIRFTLIHFKLLRPIRSFVFQWFIDSTPDSPKTRAKQDLDVIKGATLLHNAQNEDLRGTSLNPLLGRYLQEIPTDPWGNQYMLDTYIGIIISFGEDGTFGGTGMNEDLWNYYKPQLQIKRAQYNGKWGLPQKNSELIISMNKQFEITSWSTFEDSIQLLRDVNCHDCSLSKKGRPISFREMNETGHIPPNWILGNVKNKVKQSENNRHSNRHRKNVKHNPVVSFFNDRDTKGETVQQILPAMGLNFRFPFKLESQSDGLETLETKSTFIPHTDYRQASSTDYGIIETPISHGPLDPSFCGPDVLTIFRPPQPVPLFSGRNRGILIEKF